MRITFPFPMPRQLAGFPGGARSGALALALAWSVAGCGGAPPGRPPAPIGAASPGAPAPGPSPPAPDDCAFGFPGGSSGPADTLAIALPGTLDPRDAPVARTPLEQVAFRQLYETVVRLDCRGRLRPALAESWTRAGDGTAWRLTLRPAARFWDGTPLTGAALVAAWDRPEAASRLRAAGIVSSRAIGDREVEVTLDRPADSLPPALADPGLSPAGPADAGWRSGTGPYRPRAPAGPVAGGRASLIPARPEDSALFPARPEGAPEAGAQAAVTLRSVDRDPRDALDAGADLVVTGNPDAVAYAVARPDFAAVALPWSRIYVLLVPPDTGPGSERRGPPETGTAGHPNGLDLVSSAEARAALARDAVRVEARGAEPPFWWETPCPDTARADATPSAPGPAPPSGPPPLPGPVPPSGRGRGVPHSRIGYPANDPTARDLAARLVALGVLGPRSSAVGLAPDDLAASLRAAALAGYVVSLPRAPLVPCAERPDWPAGSRLVPLVETRMRALVRRGAAAFTVDWDGGIRLLAAPAASEAR